jgi:hypothetical protein
MPNTNSPRKPLKHHAKHKLSKQNHWSIMPNTNSPSKTIEASCQTQALQATTVHEVWGVQAYNPKHLSDSKLQQRMICFMKKYVLPTSK